MSILVTGGAGYIGSHMVQVLREDGREVVVVDNLLTGHRDAVPPTVPTLVADVADRARVTAFLREHRVDAVLHFASRTQVGESVAQPRLYYTGNLAAAAALLESCLDAGVARFILSSTAAVYGAPERSPITEDLPAAPVNPYGETKLAIEKMLAAYAAAYGLRYAALRYFNAAGAAPELGLGERHEPESHLIPIVLDAALGRRARVAVPVGHCRTSEEAVISKVGRELYEKFFKHYTRKQWGLDPSELDASVASRVPARCDRDDRYFTDEFQAMPLHGYTRMFENMLDHRNIAVVTNTDYRDLVPEVSFREMIYTGPVDAFFDHRYGKLPYRSLRFRFETHDREVFQPGAVINYPNEHDYTRVTEFKYLTGQKHPKTSVVYEHPTDEGDPYYPVPRPENAELYRRYKALADATPHVRFVGRLATYRYYNMDQVVGQALATFDQICEGSPSARATADAA